MKVTEMTDDKLVELIIAIRDQRSVDKKAFDSRDGQLKEKAEKLSGELMARFNQRGIESARTTYGTAFKAKTYMANIADKDVVRQQLAQGAWELVTLIPNKEGIKQYIAEHNDVPAGVTWREEVEVRVQRS